MDCSAGLWSCQTRGLRALVDVSIVERSRPLLVASTTDGRGLVRMGSSSGCSYPARCTPLCRSYRHVSRLRERNLCATGLSAPMGTAMAGLLLAREGSKPGVGQAKTARARHAPRAPTQARSQNDACTALILRAGSRRAGVPHPRAACHRLVQRVVGADVQHLPSVRSGRGDTRLCARDGGRNGAGCRLCHRAHGRTAMPTRRPFTH
jgi:hypothetical protein